jgi:phosphate-selective porin
MNVRVGKTRRHCAPPKVNALASRAQQSAHLRIIADADNAVRRDGDGTSVWTLAIQGVYSTVVEHEISLHSGSVVVPPS